VEELPILNATLDSSCKYQEWKANTALTVHGAEWKNCNGLVVVESSLPNRNYYKMVDKPEIEAWVRQFVGSPRWIVQVSLDLYTDNRWRCVCDRVQPRTFHSAITMFFSQSS
jgi:hypothetical protein